MDGHVISRARIEAEIKRAMERACAAPMQWGKDDCALWCADILKAAIGYDAAADFRGRYTTQRGARRVLGAGGLANALRRAARRHKWLRVPAEYAQTGDIGLMETPAGVSTVICRKRGWFVGRDAKGYLAVRAHRVRVAWTIDRNDVIAPGGGARVSFPRITTRPDIAPCTAAMQDPVSTSLALAALLQTTISVSAVAAVTNFAIATAISVGLSFAAQALTQKGSGPITGDLQSSGTNTAQQRLSTRQAAPSKRIIYGEAFVGGALFFERCKPPYLYRGYLLCARKINGIKSVYIGNNQLSFSSLAPNTILTPLSIDGQPDYAGHLQVSIRHGDADQAIDPLLARDFADLDPSFRQQGIATVVVRYQLTNSSDTNTALWGASGNANTFFVVDGVSVYDPRDPTQSQDDESTWKFSRNATLCQADYIRASYGGRVRPDKIDWDKIAYSANYDDEPVSCADGTFIPRYTVDGMLTLDQKPYDVLKSMLTANRATVATGGGRLWISSAKPRDAALCVYDDLFLDAVQVRNEKLKRDQINVLQTRFIANDRAYTLADGPPYRRADLIALDGEELVGTLDLPWTTDYRRVERLQKAFLETSRLGKAVTSTIDLRSLAEAQQELTAEPALISSDLFPMASGQVSINSLAFVNDFTGLQVSMTEIDSSIEGDWIAARDERAFTVASLDLS